MKDMRGMKGMTGIKFMKDNNILMEKLTHI